MEKCRSCGAELLSDARFCGKCGAARETVAPADELTQISNAGKTPLLPDLDPAATLLQKTQTPPPPTISASGSEADEATTLVSASSQDEERRKAALTGLAAPALLSGGQAAPASLPAIQGTPQVSSIPHVPGTPQPGAPLPPTHDPGRPHGWQQPTGQAVQHTAGHTLHAAAGKTVGGLAAKWIVLMIAVVVVAGGSGAGALAYVLTRPQPVIFLASPYKVGNTPAGASGTSLHIQGEHFSGSSAITFLLDSRSAPGAPRLASDAQGNISVNLPVTSGWSVGRHTLTARDAGGYATKTGVLIEVVAQGVAHTPGPFGAPPDDASFKITVSLQGQYDQGGGPFKGTEIDIVTGHADPAGGSVCQPEDDGQPHEYSSQTLDTSIPETQTLTASCSGTYKGGKLTFTERLLTDTVQLNDNGAQITCHLLKPGIDEVLTGTWTAQGIFSGTITYSDFPRSDFSCTTGPFSSFYFFLYGGSGTWTGTLTSA